MGRRASGARGLASRVSLLETGRTATLLGASWFSVGLLAVLGLPACTSESSSPNQPEPMSTPVVSSPGPSGLSGNHPPVVRMATIVPDPARRNEPVLVQVEGEDPDKDPVTYRFQWLVDGRTMLGDTTSTLDPSRFQRGQELMVEVLPSDGKQDGEPFRSRPVEVVNSLPEVTRVTLEPNPLRSGDRLVAKAEGVDADQDFFRYTFKWWRNSQPIAGGEDGILETTGFVRGDTLVAQAIPHDGEGPGKPKYSEPLTVSNSAPTITSKPPTAIDKVRYEYAVTAVDPDGDRLTFKLESAPAGMTIDAEKGQVRWELTASSFGTHKVRVAVEDGQGGRAFQEFELGLAAPPVQEPASS